MSVPLRRFLALVVGTAVGLWPVPGLAHGTFVDARPLPGVTVGGTVDEVAFLFPEPIQGSSAVITVTDPEGATVAVRGKVESPTAAVVRVGIEPLSMPGEYRVAHQVTSTDGYVFEGEFRFWYDAAAPALDPLPYGRERLTWETGVIAGALLVAVVLMVRRSRASRRSLASRRDGLTRR